MDPPSTFAIVVGIDAYDAGDNWTLHGPREDALRFTKWLRKRGVPEANILVFVSPVAGVEFPPGVVVQPARRHEINEAIRTTLAQRGEELFFFFWGGHGAVREDFTRRLFYSDATAADKKNLDLNDLILALRSSYFKKNALRQQILIIDTCASYAAKMGWNHTLPSDQFARGVGAPVGAREQFILLATRPGDAAINLDWENTGLFSRELFKQLDGNAAWPPDFKAIGEDLMRNFVELRKAGHTEQSPGYSWFRDADGFDRELGGLLSPEGTPVPEPPRSLDLPARRELVDALLAIPCVLDRQSRERILRELPRRMANSIERAADNFGDVFEIVKTSLRHPGGFAALWKTVRAFDSGTEECEALASVIAKHLPEVADQT